ncbi:MAG: SLOG family protein [Bacteroidota bacterium]
MKEKNLIIAGSRNFSDYQLLASEMKKINSFASKYGYNFSVISGNAKGADRLGILYANENNLPCKIFEANWPRYRKMAGIIRNIEMAKHAQFCLVFWDGKSKGTENMIHVAKCYELITRVVLY